MKKQAISLLLALAMVVGIVLPAIPAVQADETTHSHCVCNNQTFAAQANHEHDETQNNWAPWPQNATEEDFDGFSGKYYLTGPTTVDATIWVDGNLTICLNGYTLTSKQIKFNYDTDTVEAQHDEHVVNICDCSAEKTGALTSSVKQLFFNSDAEKAHPATINIWGGTISDTATGGYMGLVFTLGGTKTGKNVLNVYGGTIIGGTVDSTSSNSAQGGVMRISAGTECNIYGGTVQGGVATSSDAKSAQGGNIYMTTSTTKLNIYGGTIKNGDAKKVGAKVGMGGNIYAAGGTVTIEGGTIEGGTSSSAYGGNIYAVSAVTLNFNGGTIISAASGSTIVHNTKKITMGTIEKVALEIKEEQDGTVSAGVGYTADVTVTGFDMTNIEAGVKLRKETSTTSIYDGKTATDLGLTSGETKTVKGRITGMMKEDDTSNATAGVVGASYVKIGGTTVESVECTAFSAKTVIEKLDAASLGLNVLADLYKIDAYNTAMASWNIPNIKAKAAA